MAHDDWHAFSLELWGIHVTSWQPVSDRVGRLPEPLEYDVLQDGLIELDKGQRHALLQCVSCYQVRDSSPEFFTTHHQSGFCHLT
jgi:hypothetical protein